MTRQWEKVEGLTAEEKSEIASTTGKATYELVKQDDGSIIWEEKGEP